MLKLHLVPAVGGRGFGLQAEVSLFRAFGSIHGGLEATATVPSLSGLLVALPVESGSGFVLSDPAPGKVLGP